MTDEFHLYRVDWTSKSIRFFVDDIEYGIVDGGFKNDEQLNAEARERWQEGGWMAPFDTEVFQVHLSTSILTTFDFSFTYQ